MSDGIWIKYTELSQVNEKLKTIVAELDEAGAKSDELEGAIGSPFGRGTLRDAASGFESRWNDKRGDLSRDIKKVQEHVQGVLDGIKDWDAETAAQFELDVSGAEPARKI